MLKLRRRLSVLLASTVVLAAPSWAQEAPAPHDDREADAAEPPAEPWAPVAVDAEGRSAYGLYLAGRLAIARGQASDGAALLQRAQVLAPEQAHVRDQAFTAALLAGDLDFAAAVAPSGEGVGPVLSEAGKLTAAVQAFAHGDATAALARLQASPVMRPHARAALYIQPWIAAAAGDWDTALAEPPALNDPAMLIARSNRARLLELRGRHDDADAAWRALIDASPTLAGLFRAPYGEFLERRGRRADALAVYDAAIAAGAEDLQTHRARERVAARRRAPAAPTFRQGGAIALNIAAQQSSAEGAHEFASVYQRLAISLDAQPLRYFQLGQSRAEAGFEVTAREAYAAIDLRDPLLYAAARTEMGRSFARQEKANEALDELRRAYAAQPESGNVAFALVQQLIAARKNTEALEILNAPVLNTADQGWPVHFLRGAAYEQSGRLVEAQAELWAALQMDPENATLLNYLGYLWVDGGERVEQGAEMIARAHAADPDDGNIQDSLGWAQYRRGLYEDAVVNLEGAVAKEPANAEINDHLGDVYWRVGRRREAVFQWTRVLTLDVDDDRRAEVTRKLAEGLERDAGVNGAAQP